MLALRIAVCVKPVPDPAYYDRISVDKETKRLQRSEAPSIINELDRHAVIKAVELKERFGGSVTIISMAPESGRMTLMEALAFGADTVLVLSDRKFAGADTLATAFTLAEGISKAGPFDLILTGNESSDGGTNKVSAQLGEALKIPHFLHVKHIAFDSEGCIVEALTDKGINTYKVTPPLLCGVTHQIAELTYPNLKNIKKAFSLPYTVYNAETLGIDTAKTGDPGSPTKAGAVYEQQKQRHAEILTGTADEIVDRLFAEMKKAGVFQGE